MRIVLVGVVVVAMVACTKPDSAPQIEDVPDTFSFGPYTLGPSQEISDQCVQITLHNDAAVFVNQVELTTGVGFHHSNWFFVPENEFLGPNGENDDATFNCAAHKYSEPAAALFGGVLFAQSTQAPHETQAFPDGVALKIPPHSKLFAQLHLLNTGDTTLQLSPTIRIGQIPEAAVHTLLAGVSFEDEALGLPAHASSAFTLECDIAAKHESILGRAPDFKLYYALAHYHSLGTRLTVDAVRADGTSTNIFTTDNRAGDVLGGPIDPLFDFTGYATMRFSCQYENPRDQIVGWGIGDQEMCVFLAFSDSPYHWGGGATSRDAPGPGTDVGGVMTFAHHCDVYGIDATH